MCPWCLDDVHDRGGPYGRTKGARHVVAVDVTGCFRRLVKSFENATTSATGWLQVACIATTLRHPSRERARRRPVVLAA
ncbi:hypothetical protein AAII07_28125 [Microvirga sp. 0TCS3.31]